MAKNRFCKKKGIFSGQSDVIKPLFFICHACMRKSQNLDLFCESISILLSCSLFSFAFLVYQQFCYPLYRPSFAWICGWLPYQERGKFNLQRVVCKQRNWQSIFPQNVTFFVSATLTGLVRMKPACFSTDRDLILSVFTSYSSDLTLLTLKDKS